MSEYKATTTNSVNCEIRPYVGIKAGSERMSMKMNIAKFMFGDKAGELQSRLEEETGVKWSIERTCHIDGGYFDGVMELPYTQLSCGHDIPWDTAVAVGLYCAYCGAKVVDE